MKLSDMYRQAGVIIQEMIEIAEEFEKDDVSAEKTEELGGKLVVKSLKLQQLFDNYNQQ